MKCRAACITALLVLFVVVLFTGCVKTNVTSIVNPEITKGMFTSVIVHANFQNLEYRQFVENDICLKLNKQSKIKFLRSLDVFFPGQTYTNEEVANKLAERGIDGIMVIQAKGSGTSSVYIPQTTNTTVKGQVVGNTYTGTSTTTSAGGYNVTKPWAEFETTLISMKMRKTAWYAVASTGGNAFSNWQDLLEAAVGEIVKKAASDGIF